MGDSTSFNQFSVMSILLRLGRGEHAHNVTQPNCTSRIDTKRFYEWWLFPGILIPILLGCFVQRKSFFRNKWKGRPGVAIPMNALEMRHNRIPYLLAFGAVVNTVVLIIFAEDRMPFVHGHALPAWAAPLMKVVGVVVYATVTYPLFAAISAESVLGYAVAMCYCVVHLTIQLYNVLICRDSLVGRAFASMFFRDLPPIVFLILLLCYLPYLMYLLIRDKEPLSVSCHRIEMEEMRMYVSNLLQLHAFTGGKFAQQFEQKLEELKMRRRQGFYFPPRFLCSLLVALIVLLMVWIQTMSVTSSLFEAWEFRYKKFTKHDNRTMREVFHSFVNVTLGFAAPSRHYSLDLIRILEYLIYVMKLCCYTSFGVCLVFKIIEFPWICVNFKRNILAAYCGKYPVVRHPSTMTPVSSILGFCRFAGFQAVYLVWGFVIQNSYLFFILFFYSIILFIPIANGLGDFWLTFLRDYWLVFFIVLVISYVEYFVVKFVFTQHGSNIAVDNRQAFFVWVYYIFFFDLFMGAVSCLIRILDSLTIGVIFIGRIDYCVISRQFESMDPGFNCYCAFVLTEIAHNNPIMRTFLDVLYKEVHAENGSSLWSESMSTLCRSDKCANPRVYLLPDRFDSENFFKRRNRKPMIRWHLFYTLIHNRSLCVLRKHYIAAVKRDLEEKRSRRGEQMAEGYRRLNSAR